MRPILPQASLAAVTVIDYAVTTRGRQCLPALLDGMRHYDSWETLIPAVFGTSASDFERVWQAHLAMRYGL
jgi:hypothetical protein